MNVAIVILTFNEEKHIEDAIKSAQLVSDEIILIDSGSSDGTIKIAENLGAKVYFRAWDNDFASQRNFALEKTEADFMLYLDADERISEILAENIKKAVLSKEEKSYTFKRTNVAFNHKFKYGAFRADKVLRLFPKNSGSWQGKVHESWKSNLEKVALEGELLHYPYDTWAQYFVKFNNYTTLWANDAFKNGKKTSPINVFAHAVFSFVKTAIIDRGVLDGFYGITTSIFHFTYTLVKYLKLYELTKDNKR